MKSYLIKIKTPNKTLEMIVAADSAAEADALAQMLVDHELHTVSVRPLNNVGAV